MSCPQYDTLHAFVAGRLDPGSRETVQGHIDQCTECFTAVVTLAEALEDSTETPLPSGEDGLGFEDTVGLTQTLSTGFNLPLSRLDSDGEQVMAKLGAPGTDFDHFRVIRTLGRGGMGEVYLARDMQLGRKVALKVIRPEMLGSGSLLEQFLFEAKTTAKFNHPHIVTIYAVGQVEGVPYVALEYLEGQDLRNRKQLQPRVSMKPCGFCLL